MPCSSSGALFVSSFPTATLAVSAVPNAVQQNMNKNTSVDEGTLLGALLLRQLATLYDTEKVEYRQTAARLSQTIVIVGFFVLSFALAFIWYFVTNLHLKTKYGKIISIIDTARSSGAYSGPSGIATAWAYSYGAIGSFVGGFLNGNLPAAIMLAYYTAATNATFMNSPTQTTAQYLQQMLILSESTSELTALEIMCTTLYPSATGDPPECKNFCIPSNAMTADGKASAYLGAATSGIMTGVPIAIVASKLFPPFGTIVGSCVAIGLLGAQMGMTSTSLSRQQAACIAASNNCIGSNLC